MWFQLKMSKTNLVVVKMAFKILKLVEHLFNTKAFFNYIGLKCAARLAQWLSLRPLAIVTWVQPWK